MALVVKDRVRVTSTTAGTGTITLGAAVQGFQDFTVIGNGNTTYYGIVDAATGAWEVGIGTYTSSGTTLSRDTVLESSNSGNLVDFLANPKDVFVTYPAERSVYVDAANATADVPSITVGAGTVSAPSITTTGDSNTGIYFPAADTIGFVEGGVEAMRIDSSGNVGIGTTSPGARAEIYVSRTSSTNAVALILNDNVTGAQTNGVYKAIRSLSNNGSSVSELRFLETDGTNNNTGIAFATAPTAGGLTERMRIDSSGNVGIGTSSPGAKLSVDGSAIFNDSGANVNFRVESAVNQNTLFIQGSDGFVGINGSTRSSSVDTVSVYRYGSSLGNNAQISIDANANSGTGQAALKLLAGSGTTNRASRIDFLNGVSSTTAPRWTLINDYNQSGANDFRLVSPTNTAVIVADADDNVGIGTTTTTSTTLNIVNLGPKNEIVFRGTPYTNIYSETTNGIQFGITSTGSSAAIEIFTNNTERMRLDSAGNLGLGLTDPNTWGKFVVAGAGTTDPTDFHNLRPSSVVIFDTNGSNTGSTSGFFVARGTSGPDAGLAGGYGVVRESSGNWGTALTFYTRPAATANIRQLAERMRIDSSGNVGIGTSSPGARLDVVTTGQALKLSTAANQTHIEFRDTTNSKSGYLNYNNDSLIYFRNGPVQVFNFDSAGNLGLGVTPSAWASSYKALQIGARGSLYAHTSVGATLLGQNVYDDGTAKYIATAAASLYQLSGGVHYWYTAPSGTAGNAITFTQAMTLDASGNLGVGTTSPISRFDVRAPAGELGRFAINNSGVGYLLIGGGTSTSEGLRLSYNNSDGSSTINNFFNAHLAFATNNTERARITSGGDFLVGTTSSLQSSNRVSIQGPASTGGEGVVTIFNTVSSSSGDISPALVCSKNSVATSSDQRFIQFYVGGVSTTAMGGIVGNGASNVQFASISDRREKTNIAPISGSLEKVIALNPVEFDWIANGEHCSAGFVAQDVEEVFPEFVIENFAQEGQEPRKGLTGGMTGGIIPHLVKAIQELKAELDTVKAELNTLKGA
jgi:hypothetical protein